MTTLLVHGGQVLHGVDVSGVAQVGVDTGLLVQDGGITEVGPWPALRARHPGLPVLGGAGSIVVPGLVNAHHHTGLTPTQHGIADQPLEFWLPQLMGNRAVDSYLDTLVSATEMAACGVTTVQHIHGGLSGPPERWDAMVEAVLRAYRTVGLRVSLCFMVRDQNRVVYGDDDAFLATLPAGLADGLRPILAERAVRVADQLAYFEALAVRYAGDDMVRIQLAPGNLHWCSDNALVQLRDAAVRMGFKLHMHLLETWYQKLYADARCGGSAITHLEQLGLLGPQMTLGHGIWIEPADLERIAGSGACVCHQASSGLRICSGVAPVGAMHRGGVTVALGIDQAGLNDDRDMLLEMRLAWALQRRAGHGETPPSAAAVLRMATQNGADTTGFAGLVGRLDPGCAADLLVLDGAALSGGYLDPATSLADAVLHRAKAEHVTDVLVAGRTIKRAGNLVGADAGAVRRELAQALAGPPTAEEAARRQLVRDLAPHIRRFYADWPSPPAPFNLLS